MTDPFTPAVATSAGGELQNVRYHLALAGDDAMIHAVLQYRGEGDRDWHSAMQTICGLRDPVLGAVAYPVAWCGGLCWDVWRQAVKSGR